MYLRLTLVMLISLALAVPARAQDTHADPLAFTPTGDALWDTYARALLDAMDAAAGPEELAAAVQPPALPAELLDGWVDRFGDDPRYWQLRYWDAGRRRAQEDGTGLDPSEILEAAREHDCVDSVIRMLGFKHERDELVGNWARFAAGELAEDSDFAARIPDDVAEYYWYATERLRLADDLVADCPEESWAWYERALTRFEFGEWEAGLDDLRAGNLAPNNRLPQPFPVSFINERLAAEAHCGSPVAAGLVLRDEPAQELPYLERGTPDFTRQQDRLQDQLVRLSIGAGLEELAPWHTYICRFGSMNGTGQVHWQAASRMHGMLLKHLFVETPEIFSLEQREALWDFHCRCGRVMDLCQEASQSRITELNQAMDILGDRYGVDMESSAEPEFADAAEELAFQLEVVCVYLRWSFICYGTEHAELYPQARERFERLAEYDMADFSWPEDDT